MTDPVAYQRALMDAGEACAQAAHGGIGAAMATAGLVTPDQLPPGMEMPDRNLNDAAAISSIVNNAADAAVKFAQALSLLQSGPLKNPAGTVPDLYPPASSNATTTPA